MSSSMPSTKGPYTWQLSVTLRKIRATHAVVNQKHLYSFLCVLVVKTITLSGENSNLSTVGLIVRATHPL